MSLIDHHRDRSEPAHLTCIVGRDDACLAGTSPSPPVDLGTTLRMRDVTLTPAEMDWRDVLMLLSNRTDARFAPVDRGPDAVAATPDWYWRPLELRMSLYLTIVFILSVWTIAALALAVGACGEIILATMATATAGAAVEWMAHRSPPGSRPPHCGHTALVQPKTLSFLGGSKDRSD